MSPEQPPERPDDFEDYSNDRDLTILGESFEELMDRITQEQEETRAREALRRLIDTKERGERHVTDEELAAAHDALRAARKNAPPESNQ